MKSTSLRTGALVAAGALALGLAQAPAASAAVIATPTGADRSAADLGAAYLAAQPGTDGLITTYYVYNGTSGSYEDVGLTIDAATSLSAVGGQAAKVAAMTAAVRANIPNYVFGANTAAKMAAFLLSSGLSGSDVDDVVDDVEDSVTSSGRVSDMSSPDYASPLGQAYAAQALSLAGSSDASSVLSFLLTQQCSAGFYRASFSTPAADADQSCDAAPSAQQTPSVDTTAFTVLDLQAQKSASAVATSLTRATAWLASQQAADGSFNDGNANSTGLAGWALGVSGNTAAAAKAAGWLRGHQLANAGTCTKYAVADNGAVTLDDLGYANAASGPLDAVDNSTAARATAQALPALLWAPGGAKSGETTIAPVAEHAFVKGGSTQGVTVSGAPGNTVCVTVVGTTSQTRVVLPASGTQVLALKLPEAGDRYTVAAKDVSGSLHSFVYDVLGQKTLKLRTAKRLERGSAAKIRVTGLAPKEKVRVYLGKKLVRKGRANAHGVFARHYAVTHRTGPAKLKVLGQFGGLRRDVQKVRVVR